MRIRDLNTGDILLFYPRSNNFLFKVLDMGINYFTESIYTHTAFVLKDPTFIDPSLKGIYIWESSYEGSKDPQDGKVKFGVQITPLYQFLRNYNGCIYVRKLIEGRDKINNEILKEIHNTVYNKPYDDYPIDWIEAINRKDSEPQKTDRFWCSALVTYILVKLGFLKDDTDWSMMRPCDLSSTTNYLKLINCKYKDDIKVYEKWHIF